jgi:predicted PurR-regulated permease PerM
VVSRQSVEQAIGIAVLALIAVGTFLVLRPFLSGIIWAAVLTFTTWPLFTRVNGWFGGRRSLAALVMIVAAACVLLLPLAALALSMGDQVARLGIVLRQWLDFGLPSLPTWVADVPLIGGRLMRRWQEFFQTGDIAQNIAPYTATLRSYLVATATIVANAFLELLLSLLIAFFLYCNGVELSNGLGSVSQNLTGERGKRLILVVASTVRSVVEGLLGTNLLQAILGALGFWVAGIPAALLLGFFVFFLTVIPFGSGLVWVPAVIWLATTGHSTSAVLLTVWCILIFPVLENVVRPYLVKRGSDLPALLILLGMLGGMSAFGFLGVFLGPALLALVYTLIEEWRAPAKRS